MSQPNSAQSVDPPGDERPIRSMWTGGAFRHDVLAICALALLVALTTRGHFVNPHPDLYEFIDSGHALLSGQLPPTMKRAPVYGLVVVAVSKLLAVEAPERIAAEWINVALLPACALLIYLIARRWVGGAARWAAAWFILLPFTLYLTAHIIAELFLTFTILLTVFAAQRRIGWAYVAAALAVMTRYDVAGLLLGVFIADLLQRKRPWTAIRSAAIASAPLAVWLLLTALTWVNRSDDHYLAQMAERQAFDLRSLWWPFITVLDLDALRLPGILFDLDEHIRTAAMCGLVLAVIAGVLSRCRRRDPAVHTVLAAFLCYVAVHAVFPFQFQRFGFPMAPLVILLAAEGVRSRGESAVWTALLVYAGYAAVRANLPFEIEPFAFPIVPLVLIPLGEIVRTRFAPQMGSWPSLRLTLICILGLVLTAAIVGEADGYAVRTGLRNPWSVTLAFLVATALAVLWISPVQRAGRRLSQTVLLLALILVATVHIRSSLPLMGSGQEDRNQIEAARWIRDNIPPESRVLCPSPGLMKLYAGREPRSRFIAFGEIEAESWPDILNECRERNIEYIIWHDQLFQRLGDYYAAKYRTSRFDVLKNPEQAGGVTIERRYAHFPNLVILRIETADERR